MYRAASLAPILLLVLFLNVFAEEKDRPRPKTLRGQVSKVEGNDITITTRGDSGEKTHAFTLGKDTKVTLETAEDVKIRIRGEGGEREVIKPKTVAGKAGDIKVGQSVSVIFTAADKVNEVQVHRPAKKRKEGEGR